MSSPSMYSQRAVTMPQPVANQTRSWWHRALDLFTLHPPKAFRTHHDPVTAASLVPEPASPAQSKAPRSPTSPQSPTSAASQKKSKSLWRISQGGHGSSRGHSSAAGERLITHIASDDQFEQLINGGQWVLVDFHADWCPPCKAIAPHFASQAVELERVIEAMCPPGIPNPVVLAKLDVDDFHELCTSANVSVMPTFKLYHDGFEVDTVAGCSKAGLDALFEDAMRRSGLIL